MFIITAILLLIFVLFVLLFQLTRKKNKLDSKAFTYPLIITVITSIVMIVYFLLPFSCLDGCYVDKYTPLWFATMNQSTIGSLPIVKAIENPQYYYDSELGELWQITYKSEANLNEIQAEIKEYLAQEDVQFNVTTSCHNGYWDIHDDTVIIPCKAKGNCIMIYLDDNDTHVLVRALEMK